MGKPTGEHIAGLTTPSSCSPVLPGLSMLRNHKVLKMLFSFSLKLKFSTAHFGAWAAAEVSYSKVMYCVIFVVVIAEMNCILIRKTRCTF